MAAADAAGRLWVGTIYEPRDHPGATLYSVSHGVLQDRRLPATFSNGVAFSPDNRTMYRTDTTSHTIRAYEFDVASGELGAAACCANSRKTEPTTTAAARTAPRSTLKAPIGAR